jgi:hypothetical protein
MYRKFEVILIAIEDRETKKITLNPAKILKDGDIGFFMSLTDASKHKMRSTSEEDSSSTDLDIPLLAAQQLQHQQVLLEPSEPLLINHEKEEEEELNESEDVALWTQKIPELKDVVLKKVAFSDHVVVVSPKLGHHLLEFIRPLRRKTMPLVKIVFLSHNLPDEGLWEAIGIFPELYFVQGTAPKDIQKLYPAHAKQIVVLADAQQIEGKSPEFADAPSIAVIRGIHSKLVPFTLSEISRKNFFLMFFFTSS